MKLTSEDIIKKLRSDFLTETNGVPFENNYTKWLENKISLQFAEAVSVEQDHEKILDEIAALKDYWYNRYFCAEKFISESPCDPDITAEQCEAYKNWQEAIKEPKS